MYFAIRFQHINEKIRYYWGNHIYLFDLVFDRNPHIQSQTPMPYCLGTMEGARHITVKDIKHMDSNFTTYGPNGQMSILECAIKSHSVYFKKILICKNLIERGAHYDIWIPGILKKEQKLASYKSPFSFFTDEQNADEIFLKRMRQPMLLSEFIAYHKDLTEDLALLIMQKGTASQDIFIKRFPNLEFYRKNIILTPEIPADFKTKNAFSLFRCYYLEHIMPGFLKKHFNWHIYQPINYKKTYKHYNTSYDNDEKTILDYMKKTLQDPKAEMNRLQISTVLENRYLRTVLSVIQYPKRLKWLLIEFAASQSKKKIIVSSMLFIAINWIALYRCFKSFLNKNHRASCCYAFIALITTIFFKKPIHNLMTNDTLYDPYYFFYL
jgi:hypothetical protein